MKLVPRNNNLGFSLFDNMFDDMFRDPFFTSSNTTKLMKTDIQEKDDKYILDMDLPGYDKEDIKAQLKDGYLTISAQKNTSNDEKDEEEVYDLRKSEEIFSIKKENENTYRIVGERVLRTYHLINLSEEEGVLRLIKYLNDIGVEEALEKMGAKNGDTVILDDFEFEYFA